MFLDDNIHNFLSTAQIDLDAGFILIEEFNFTNGIAMCRMGLVKVFKAAWIGRFRENPPDTDNLAYLAKKTGFDFEPDQQDLIFLLAGFDLHNKSPEDIKAVRKAVNKELANEILDKTEAFASWLKKHLRK